jgi:hypothetical protein
VDWDEKKHFLVCGQMLDMLERDSETQASRRIIAAFAHTLIEMGGHHYRFYHQFTKDHGTEGYHVGNYGQVD